MADPPKPPAAAEGVVLAPGAVVVLVVLVAVFECSAPPMYSALMVVLLRQTAESTVGAFALNSMSAHCDGISYRKSTKRIMGDTYVVQSSSVVAKSDHLDGSLGPLGNVDSSWDTKIWQAKNTLGDIEEPMLEQGDVEARLPNTKTQVDE